MTPRAIGMAIALAALALAPVAQAASPAGRHSGTIVAVDPSHDTITVQSVGPTSPGKAPNFEKRTIHLTGSTTVQMAERAAQGGHLGFPNSWVERPFTSAHLAPGDFVNVDTERGAQGLTASSIQVVRIEAGQAGSTESQPAASPQTHPSAPSQSQSR